MHTVAFSGNALKRDHSAHMFCWLFADTFECKRNLEAAAIALHQPLLDFFILARDDGRSVPFSRETAARKWRQVIFKEKEWLVLRSPVTSKNLNLPTMHAWRRIEVTIWLRDRPRFISSWSVLAYYVLFIRDIQRKNFFGHLNCRHQDAYLLLIVRYAEVFCN